MVAIARSYLLRAAVRLVAMVAVAGGAIAMSSPPATADWVRNDQWQVKTLDARDAWKLATGDGVIVAVIDSGVDATHPDLAGQILPGADFVDGSTDGQHDLVGHGTTIAGLIAGRGDDTNGVVGLAPKTKILPVRVLDKENKYDDPAVVAKGLHWAVDHGASVINLSLGGQLRSDVLAEALDYAASHDVVVVACTGNVSASSPSRDVWYPAREPGVVAVAGLVGAASATSAPSTVANTGMGGTGGASESLWSGSLTGSQTVLTAPAVNLLGAKPGGYWRVQGTSFAAPLVAATAALIRSRYPGMNAANVINRLIRTARDLGPPGRDDRYGYGEVDPLAALRIDAPPVTANPLGGASSIAAGSTEGAAPSPSRAVDASGGHGSPVPSKLPAGVQSTGARDSNHAGGSGVGMAARVASSERRLGASMAIGGAVAALLFMVGLLVSRSRRKTP